MKRRKFWKWLAVGIVVLLVLVRFVGLALVPGFIDSALRERGFTSEIDDLDLSVFAGEFRLRGLVIRALDGEDPPLVELQHVAVDLDLSSTLFGDPACHRVELDGLIIDLRRTKELGWNFASLIASEPSAEAEAEVAEESEPAPLDLRSPVRIASLRAQDIHVRVFDDAGAKPIKTELTLNMTASTIGDENSPGHFEVIADARDVLDFMRFEASLESSEHNADANVSFELRGFHAAPIQAWLESAGLRCDAGSIDVRGGLTARAEVSGEEAQTLTATIDTADWSIEADGAEAVALDSSHHVVQLSPLAVRTSELSGMRAHTRQGLDGALSVAGISALGSGNAIDPAPEPAPSQTAADQSAPPFSWQVDSFSIRQAAITHQDAASGTDLELRLDSLDLSGVDSSCARPAALEVLLSAPGIFEEARVVGALTPDTNGANVQAEFDLSGLTPERCRALLERAGLESRLEAATAHGELSATIATDRFAGEFALHELWLQNGERRTEFGSLSVKNFALGHEILVGEVLGSGLRLVVERHENGDLEVAGVVLKASGSKPLADNAPSKPSEPQVEKSVPTAKPNGGSLPIVKLDHLAWSDTRFEFLDLANPASNFQATDLQLEIHDFALGSNSDCTLRFQLDSAQWWDRLTVEGTLKSTVDSGLAADLDLALAGLNGTPLGSVLAAAGLAPTFEKADMRGHLNVESVASGATVRLTDVAFQSRERTLFGLTALAVTNVKADAHGIDIGAVIVEGPQVRLDRSTEGNWILAGLRVIEAPATVAAEVTPVQQTEVASSEPAGFSLGSLQVAGGRLLVRDEFNQSPVETSFTLGASLSAVKLGSRTPVELSASFALDGEPMVFSLGGELIPDLEAAELKLQIAAEGLTGERLDRFLPEGLGVALDEGAFRANARAELNALEAGGHSATLLMSDAQLTEQNRELPLFALERAELSASRLDAEAGFFEIDRLHAVGIQLDVARETGGALSVAGLRVEAPKQTPPVDVEPAPSGEVREASGTPLEERVAVTPKVVSWARQYDETPLPTVLLNSMELELAALRFHDRSHAEAQPATFSARLNHAVPLVLLSPDTESIAPLEFILSGAAEPIVASYGAQITLSPWEEEARLAIAFQAAGIRGSGITEVLPELAAQLDGSGLENGRLDGSVELRLVARRRNPVDFNLANGFGLELAVRDFAIREGDHPAPLAGMGELEVVVNRFDPATGAARIESVDISNLAGSVRLTERGPKVLGLVLLSPPASSNPKDGGQAAVTEPVAVEPYSGPEIQLDRLSVSGLDFLVTDERTVPETLLPFNSLDVDLERFTTLTFTEYHPFHFGFYLGAGAVRLPKPKAKKSVLSGLTQAALSAAVGGKDEFEYEERSAFSEIAVTGSLSLGPKPTGRVNANIDGFELLNVSGLAKQSGVEIGGGVLDTWARVNLKGEKGIDVRSNVLFTELSLDEPPDGPISRYLKLPAPLNSVLFALENQDDEHRIPLNFSLGTDGISGPEIARVAVTTLAQIIGSAIASAPLRVGDSVAGMIAIPGMEDSPVSWLTGAFRPLLVWVGLADKPGPRSKPVTLEYPAGDFTLPPMTAALLKSPLREIAKREDFIVVLQHQFGEDDFARAALLANPSKEECLRIASGLRQRKRELLRRRSELAADVASIFAIAGEDGAHAELEALRKVEAELGHVELALDEALVQLRPGSERHADRRTRRALLEIADARLKNLEEYLARAMKGDVSERFEIKRPRASAITGEAAARVFVTLKMRAKE